MGLGWRLASFVLLAKSYGSYLQQRGPPALRSSDLARISKAAATDGPAPFPGALRGGLGFSLRNQNLLYLVFKCRINTNHSSSWSTMQVLFDAQKGGPKSFGKSAK